jgi:hypothetical protein
MESKFKTKVSITNIYEHSSSIWYNVSCDCNSEDHVCQIEFEYDKKCNMIVLHFYKNVSFDWWKYDSYKFMGKIKNFWNRIKKAFKLLFTGELSMSETFMLVDIKHIESFIEALQEGLGYCKEEKIRWEEEFKVKTIKE